MRVSVPADHVVVPATPEDAEELQRLFAAHRRSVLGFCRVTVEEVRSWLQPGAGSDALELVVRRRDSAAAVQWWRGAHEAGDPRYFGQLVTHPDLAVPVADELWGAGWVRLRAWVEALRQDAGGSATIRSACLLGDADEQRRLAAVGLVHERTYWEMAGPVQDREQPKVPGLVVTGAAEPATVHAVLQLGFREHWDFQPQTLDAWLAAEQSAVGHDAGLWFVAEVDGEVAGAMVLCRYDDELYVQEVATLPGFRRRGVASALLARAFVVAGEKGYAGVMLHVDSDNADGAPHLYRAAGLRVRHATLQHVGHLPG